VTIDQKPSTLYHCIKCGKVWGGSTDNQTSGLCIDCFATWAVTKYSCFGNYNNSPDCKNCKISKYCKVYYESKIPVHM